MSLERSEKGKFAKSVFYHSDNDIDVYIEDTQRGSQKLYTILLSRALPSRKIKQVFPIGDKPSVIKRCIKDDDSDKRPRVYIVDGDLELLSEQTPLIPRLYTLKRYCIENYLACEQALLNLIYEEDVERDMNAVSKAFNYEQWAQSESEILFELFLTYSLVKKHKLNEQTVKYSVNNLTASDQGDLNRNKVNLRIDGLDKLLSLKLGGMSEVAREKAEIRLEKKHTDKLLHYVSGKDYLLKLLLARVRKCVDINASNLVIKQRLALKCNVQELAEISKVIT